MAAMITNKWVHPSSASEINPGVEIFHGQAGDLVYVRKGTYSAEEWREFVVAVRAGEFDV